MRFLYDAAQNVTGGNDPRLGVIHLVLLSHMHGDHVGDTKLKAPGEGTCANSARVPAPNSTTAEVVTAKNAVLVTTRAMAEALPEDQRPTRIAEDAAALAAALEELAASG